MRMWMVDPKLLCRKHLLGEHGEIHKHRHNFVKQHKMNGRFAPIVQIEPAAMQQRHDDLAEEMLARGYNHKSPYLAPSIDHLPDYQQQARVDVEAALADLIERCKDCKERYESKEPRRI